MINGFSSIKDENKEMIKMYTIYAKNLQKGGRRLLHNVTVQNMLVLIVLLLSANSLTAQDTKQAPDTLKPIMSSTSDEYYSQTLTGNALSEFIDKEFPNSIPIPGTDIRFAIGGYIKADFLVDLGYIGDRSEFVTGSIALDGSDNKNLGGRTTFHAKETRISFDFRSKSKKGIPMRAFMDLDFFGSDDPYTYNLRLRNAAITVGRLLVGQYWETSLDLRAMPTTIDFEVLDAFVFSRVLQIRWEQSAGKHFKWAVALENPSASIDNPDTVAGEYLPYMPNIVGRIIWDHRLGHIQLAALGMQMRWKNDSLGTSSAMAIGFNLTGSLNFAKHDKFMWGFSYGNGWGSNITAFSGTGADAVLNPSGTLNAFPAFNAFAGVEHYWLSNLASTLAFGYGELQSPANRTADAQEVAASYHLNLRWAVIKKFIVGVEYMGGYQRIADGSEGFAQRIQFAARFNFTN